MKHAIAIATGTLAAASLLIAGHASAYQFYMTIDGATQGEFKGESTRHAHEGEIPCFEFEHQVHVQIDVATGHASGKRQHRPLKVTKQWGAASPQILQALSTNERLNQVRLQFVKTGDDGAEYVYHTVTLVDAAIVDWEAQGGELPNGVTGEVETVSFSYRRIIWENLDGQTAAEDDWTL